MCGTPKRSRYKSTARSKRFTVTLSNATSSSLRARARLPNQKVAIFVDSSSEPRMNNCSRVHFLDDRWAYDRVLGTESVAIVDPGRDEAPNLSKKHIPRIFDRLVTFAA